MATPDPKKLATAILRARGKPDYDELIVRTFESLSKAVESAWKVLELADERACQTSGKSDGKGVYEREVRVLGRVVAWRDSKVTTYRTLTKPGKVSLEIAASRGAAEKRAKAVADDKKVVWGTRPAADEPADSKAHATERERLFASGDVTKLKAYLEHYRGTALLVTREKDGATRQYGYPVWNIESVIQDAAWSSDEPKLLKVLLDAKPKPKPFAIQAALANAIRQKHAKVAALLLPLVGDVDEESDDDSLLSLAVRLEQPDTVAALLKAGANPNQVFSTFGHPERFKVAADEGNGPMVNAVRNGDVDTLKKLLASGGDPYSKTETGRRVIDFAKELGNKKVLAVLGSSKSKEPPMDMETAIVKNNVPRVLELIKKEGTDYALIKAADDGCLEVLRSILASKTKKDPTKVAEALWHASFNGEAKSAALLLEHGADPNFVDRLFGKTTLGAAKYRNKLPIVAMLEKAGARLRPTKK